MSETAGLVDRRAVLARAETLVDELLTLNCGGDPDAELVEFLRDLERLANKLTAARHQPILELEQRGLPKAGGARSTGGFLVQTLRIDVYDASRRVKAAHACGRRTALSGEVLPPLLPQVAAAQADGSISERVQQIITGCIAKLPDHAVECVPQVEADLLDGASRFVPRDVAELAARINYLYDQDGALADVERRRKNRGLTLYRRPDGSCHGEFDGTAELAELLDVAFDSLAKPKPEAHGVKDPRTPAQRRHDALVDVLKTMIRSKQVPDAGGVTSTIVLTMTIADYEARTGFATTGHNAQIPVTEALTWSGGDAKVMAVVLNDVNAIVAYSTLHRIFRPVERLAMTARDGGCCFPDCDAPPGWCEAHHVTEWQDSHRTSVDAGVLLCGYHHREFQRLGFRLEMIDGVPTWYPPGR